MLANLPHVLARFGSAPALASPGGGGHAPAQAPPAQRQQAQQAQQQQQQQPPGAGSERGGEEEALFLLDSGAGGVEVMFHSRAVEELALRSLPQVRTHSLKVRAHHARHGLPPGPALRCSFAVAASRHPYLAVPQLPGPGLAWHSSRHKNKGCRFELGRLPRQQWCVV